MEESKALEEKNASLYSKWFSIMAKEFDAEVVIKETKSSTPKDSIAKRIKKLEGKKEKTIKEDSLIESLKVALEMTNRNIKFLPIDLKKSDLSNFTIESDNLIRIPLIPIKELIEKGVEVDKKIVLLTQHNAEIIKNLIENDEDCFSFAECIFKCYNFEKRTVDKDKQALWAVLREIDRDNNTNAWRRKENRDTFNKIVEYILDPGKSFFKRLKEGDVGLPDELVRAAGINWKSFSSKICKYLFDYMYPDEDNPYYINDKVIRHALSHYLDYYEVSIRDELSQFIDENGTIKEAISYQELYELLEELHEKSFIKHNDKITKNELDQIIWYSYKKIFK